MMVIFLYSLYMFVWMQYSCLANMVLASDPSKSYKEVVVYIYSHLTWHTFSP